MTKLPLTDKALAAMETEEEFLKHYDLKKYPAQALTADLCIFTIIKGELSILLILRGGHPEKGKWALPGGFVNVDESVDQTAARELKEETGLAFEDGYLEQLKTYAYPGRDPRGYVTSVAYVTLAPKISVPKAGDDAAEAQFFPVKELNSLTLAFDHANIIEDGLERVRAKIEYAPIAPLFIPDETFTISELRKVYETVWGVSLNRSNFRRKVQAVPDFLIPIDRKRVSNFDGGRPGDLYRIGSAQFIYPPLRRSKEELD